MPANKQRHQMMRPEKTISTEANKRGSSEKTLKGVYKRKKLNRLGVKGKGFPRKG